jgi:PhnB protein
MAQINSYLTFNGNCREAMEFYKECFGGELVLQKVGDSPVADKVPPQMAASILHASLTNGSLMLLATDMCRTELSKGNTVTMCINCSTEEEIRNFYEKLSIGGEIIYALDTSFWGALYGELTDRFGHNWMLNFQQQQN